MSYQTKPRVLVLCFDGTSNQYDADNTNIVRFYSLLAKDQPYEQLTYYQPGVGTYFDPGVVSPLFTWAAKLLDEAFAWYLGDHVRDGYRFLMQNYRAGDKICIFGFSRGAYTARALAGFLYKIGLLPRDNQEQIPFAYKLYKRTDKEGIKLSAGFKTTFCRSVIVDFVGVWDTVASVGLLYSRNLPFTNSNDAIKFFRHALSLDERRARFQPNMYHREAPDNKGATLDPEQATAVATSAGSPKLPTVERTSGLRFSFQKQPKSDEESPVPTSPTKSPGSAVAPPQDCEECDVLEVWFAGCHSDVGGGAVSDDVPVCLADISLRWMIRQVENTGVGIRFDIPISVNQTLAREPSTSIETTGGPGDQVRADALMPVHDALKSNWLWWILEVFPMQYSWQDAAGNWHRKWSINFGRGRVVREERPKFYLTVKERMEDAGLQYSPAAKWAKGQEEYVG